MDYQTQSYNRLGKEKSPYLLQHKDNPVHWYPWGDEAFEAARVQNKPIFLSIGYSTCHWCHVMEHESFENVDVASVINQYFIAIKVDREERPDIDQVYMKAVMAMTGHGGWPLTVFLTPDKKPFYGGTYFPPFAKWGQPGLMDVMESIHQNWETQKSKIMESSVSLMDSIFASSITSSDEELSKNVLDQSFKEFESMYDSTYGGFGQSPKFPTSHNLSFLLRYWKRSGNTKAFDMAEQTLKKMAAGGMYDHLGGGFHRYSTDQQWQVPHFEKMLYDQALLAITYLEMYQITKNNFYREVAESILDYVLRDMTAKTGGFYSAEDADSFEPGSEQVVEGDSLPAGQAGSHSGTVSKKEGAFYVWGYTEVADLLGKNADIFNFHYGITLTGNALNDPHQEFVGKNIIWAVKSLAQTADAFKQSEEDVKKILKECREILFKAQKLRPRPHLDDKVLTDWNGLMIAAFSYAGRVLNEEKYIKAAQKSANFILDTLIDDQGNLLHRYRDGDAAIHAHLDDYAFLSYGLIELYFATFDQKYILKAESFSKEMLEHFWDDDHGGFYFTADDAEELISREKEIYDGAVPSGNSIAALNMMRLYHMTFDSEWKIRAEKLFKVFASKVKQRGSAYSQLLIAFDLIVGSPKEIIFSAIALSDDLKEFQNIINEEFSPSTVFMFNSFKGEEGLSKQWTHLEIKKPINDQLTVYVCQNKECSAPVTDASSLKKLITQMR